MTSINQILDGTIMFIDNELLPHISLGSHKFLIGIGTAIFRNGFEKKIDFYLENIKIGNISLFEFLNSAGIIDNDLNIELDALEKCMLPAAKNSGGIIFDTKRITRPFAYFLGDVYDEFKITEKELKILFKYIRSCGDGK